MPVSNNLAENAALRAMVTHTRDDSVHQISQTKEGTRGLTKGLDSALQQLNKTTQLPPHELWNMKESEIQTRRENIAEAITQYENHIKRGHANMQTCNCFMNKPRSWPI